MVGACLIHAHASAAVISFTNATMPGQSLIWSDTELPQRETLFRSGAAPQRVPVMLSIDPDGDGPTPAMTRAATFNIAGIFYENGGLLYYTRTSVLDGFQHEYNFRAGTIDLRDGTNPDPNAGELLLRLSFDNFAFRTTSASEDLWGETATLTSRGSNPVFNFRSITGSLAAQYGTVGENFALLLSALRDREFGSIVPIRVGGAGNPDLSTGDPLLPWQSDGSFTVTLVPTPSTLAIAGAVGLTGLARRRRVR